MNGLFLIDADGDADAKAEYASVLVEQSTRDVHEDVVRDVLDQRVDALEIIDRVMDYLREQVGKVV